MLFATDPPELHAALVERQVADDALTTHAAWMKERYGHRGIPDGAPERVEGDRLEAAWWDASRVVNDRVADLDTGRRSEYQKASDWLRKFDNQARWDKQTDLSYDLAPVFERRAKVAEFLGMTRTAEKIRGHIDVAARIADNMQRCPNNPRNGGDGFDRGDGTWVDQRGADWLRAEDQRERERQLAQADPLTADPRRTQEVIHRASVERRTDEWARSPESPRNWTHRMTATPDLDRER